MSTSLRNRLDRLEAGAPRSPDPLPAPFWSDEHGCYMQALFGGALIVPAPVSPEEWERKAGAQQAELTEGAQHGNP